MKKKICILLCIMLIAGTITGCNQNKEVTSNDTPETNVGNDFIFCLPYDITLLDPQNVVGTWDMLAILNIHDPLVRMDAQGNIYPALAEKWEMSEDGLEYRFYLRKDVKFQDGSPLTASDVKFSLDRAKSKPTAKRMTSFMDEIEVINDNEIKLTLKYPCAGALKYLSLANNCIVSEKILNEIGEDEYKNNPCGTGPFKFEKWDQGDKLVLSANKDYYLGAPKIDRLIIKTIKESTTASIALENGEVDAIIGVPEIMKQNILDNPKLDFLETPGISFWTITFNTQLAPFDNKLVRRAIYMAIDPQEIVDVALDGQGLVADIAIHPNSYGYVDDVKRHEYNIEKAKELLKEAGYPDGLSTQIYVREDFTQKIGQVLQQQLSKIGIKLEVVVMERGAWLADIREGKLTMYPMGLGDLILDAEIPLSTFDSAGIGSTNYSRFSNAEYDSLIAELVREIDAEKRKEIIRKMLLIEKEETPRVPLFFQISNIAFNKEFKGIEPYPTNFYYFYGVSK